MKKPNAPGAKEPKVQSIQSPTSLNDISSEMECRTRLDKTLRAAHRFRVDGTGCLFYFEAGHWTRVNESWTWTRCYQELPERLRGYLRASFIAAVHGNLKAGQGLIEIQPPSGLVNLSGQVIDARTGRTWKADPSNWPSPTMIPVTYNPEALCPAWDRFLASVVPTDAIEFTRSVIASALVSDTFGQRLIWLAGLGGNGKGTLLRAITELIGEANVVSISFKALAIDRFAAAQLYGKLLAVDGDSSLAQIKASESLKQVTGHDAVNAQEKYGKPFSFVPFAKPIVAANGMPNSLDLSQGFFDRPLIVPMEARWRDSGGERQQSEILEELAAEKAGFMASCLRSLAKLFETRRYSIPESIAAATTEFKASAHPMGAFAQEWLEFAPDFEIEESQLRQAQHDWANEAQSRRLNREEIANWLRTEKGIGMARPGNRGESRQKVYRGLRLLSQ